MKSGQRKLIQKFIPHSFLETIYGLSQGLGHRPNFGPRRIAGILQTRNYTDRCSVIESLKQLSDVTLVLDDNSSQSFPHRDQCDEVLTLSNREKWNASANVTLLMQRAFVHGCEWTVQLDDDLILSHGLQTKEDLNRLIDRMERENLEALHISWRDLWNSPEKYRADGVWSKKSFTFLRRNWFFYKNITLRDPSLRLHSPIFPANMIHKQAMDHTLVAYHTGCFTKKDRESRVEKYGHEDPNNTFQKDYSYMLDESNIELRPVPEADLQVIRNKFRLR